MRILSHRGYWKTVEEKNSPVAFERSFSLGFGTETDVRDGRDGLLVAHDACPAAGVTFDELLACLARHDRRLPLAINIKADGLQVMLKEALARHDIGDYFLFDMSVADGIQSLKSGLRIFTRQSDVEPAPVLYDRAAGVWMDAFFDDAWLTPTAIRRHLEAGKQVCVVSPELHRRTHLAFWRRLRDANLATHPSLLLCTDQPEAALSYFRT